MIEINSFSKYGNRTVSLSVFDRLLNDGSLFAIQGKHGATKWFFKLRRSKPYNKI